MANHRVIGKGNKLPWHFSSDLKHFKQLTMGSTVLMGRKTFESIGHPLPNRQNIILTKDASLKIPGCSIATTVEAAIMLVSQNTISAENTSPPSEVMIIGGANLYAQMIDRAHCIYLTVIDALFEGDAFFCDLSSDWKLISEEKFLADEKNKYAYRFQLWTNLKSFVS